MTSHRSFVEICKQAKAMVAPAGFGGRVLAAIEDWMTERGARRLTLQREPDGSWTVALDIGTSNWTVARSQNEVGALECMLCEAVATVFADAERTEARSAEHTDGH